MTDNCKRVHFIGVGGVGMSGIARVAADAGMRVSGSDMKSSRYTDDLVAAGIPIFIGHDAKHVTDDIDAVVISTAIPETNPELVRARELGIAVWHRAHMLAELGRGKKTLAACGTHGKTTTSSMLATATDALGLEPTFVVGGIVDAYHTNAVSGKGDYYVVEADESDGSFLNLSPYVALVTNVEADHLDHYTGGIEEIRATFLRFMQSVPEEGAVVVCGEDPKLVELAKKSGRRMVAYGFGEDCDTRISNYRTHGVGSLFTLSFADGTVVDVELKCNPGIHNALNAAGVISVLWALGEDTAAAAASLSNFQGVRRRFDLVGEACGVTVVDDYAHHPTEIKATLAAAAALDFKRVVVLFQPHRYSRTESLAGEFGEAFNDADKLVLMDVYAAGEAPIEGVDGGLIANAVKQNGHVADVTYEPSKEATPALVASKLKEGDLLITMGAGDVTTFGKKILAELSREEA